MDKILTAKDIAAMGGVASTKDLMFVLSRSRGRNWGGKTCNGPSVTARIELGRWLADCECGGAENVDPDYPFFYCCSCGNQAQNGLARPVVFPKDKDDIEAELLNRPGLLINTTVKPVVAGLTRDWKPGERVSDLKRQRAIYEKGK